MNDFLDRARMYHGLALFDVVEAQIKETQAQCSHCQKDAAFSALGQGDDDLENRGDRCTDRIRDTSQDRGNWAKEGQRYNGTQAKRLKTARQPCAKMVNTAVIVPPPASVLDLDSRSCGMPGGAPCE